MYLRNFVAEIAILKEKKVGALLLYSFSNEGATSRD
jgi:hypothetical protein